MNISTGSRANRRRPPDRIIRTRSFHWKTLRWNRAGRACREGCRASRRTRLWGDPSRTESASCLEVRPPRRFRQDLSRGERQPTWCDEPSEPFLLCKIWEPQMDTDGLPSVFIRVHPWFLRLRPRPRDALDGLHSLHGDRHDAAADSTMAPADDASSSSASAPAPSTGWSANRATPYPGRPT